MSMFKSKVNSQIKGGSQIGGRTSFLVVDLVFRSVCHSFSFNCVFCGFLLDVGFALFIGIKLLILLFASLLIRVVHSLHRMRAIFGHRKLSLLDLLRCLGEHCRERIVLSLHILIALALTEAERTPTARFLCIRVRQRSLPRPQSNLLASLTSLKSNALDHLVRRQSEVATLLPEGNEAFSVLTVPRTGLFDPRVHCNPQGSRLGEVVHDAENGTG